MSKLTTVRVRVDRVRTMTLVAALAAALALVSSVNGATLVAEYRFNGNLASSVGGAPALVSVDPLGLNAFVTDVVNGQTQQVFNWVGNAAPVTQQAGFTLDTTGLVVTNSYSVEMIFKLTQGEGQWRRLIDVEDRQSDDGFYVNPGNQLAVYPIISSLTPFTNNVYEHVVLTVGGGTISAYLNGLQQFSGTSTLMDIRSSRQMGFFIDNVVAGGQGEFSNGSIALLRLYAGVLVTPSLSIIRTSTNSVVISWPFAVHRVRPATKSGPEPGQLGHRAANAGRRRHDEDRDRAAAGGEAVLSVVCAATGELSHWRSGTSSPIARGRKNRPAEWPAEGGSNSPLRRDRNSEANELFPSSGQLTLQADMPVTPEALYEQTLTAANNLEFEKAALMRDQIKELKRAIDGSQPVKEAKQVSYRKASRQRVRR